MEIVRDWLLGRGLSETAAIVGAVVAAVLVSVLIGWVLRAIAGVPVAHFSEGWGHWKNAIKQFKLLTRLAWVIAAIAAKQLVPPLLEHLPRVHAFTEKLFSAVLVVAVAAVVSAFIAAFVDVLRQRQSDERLPFTILAQSGQFVVWTYAAVALLSVFTGKDVASVMTGLTAIGAVLVYVFRDTLLGWTAGMQLAANDLVRKGDWISVPRQEADGFVEEISLTAVKVRNWDKTISSVPTYAIFSEGFRNWRGMFESGGRRIKRALAIDATSVRFCDAELLARLNESPLIREVGLSTDQGHAGDDPFSDPRPTNLGCFRAWLEAWLKRHPKIHPEMTSMVRELEPAGRGIPVEIYVFSSDKRWEDYEKLQAEILDHVLAVLPMFELRVFQEPTGEDLRSRDVPQLQDQS